ncbi:MAG: tetraacyldisaccharide 4'-kinase [Deltaproteobacteria bacterium]
MIGLLARGRRALYARGLRRVDTLPRPVVSVGNLAAGGSGKTPHVLHFAKWFGRKGMRVAILSRGYGRRSHGVVWASGRDGIPASPDAVGDEPALLAASLPEAAVLVGESRYEAGLECLRVRDVDLFLLDDGFQHLPLARDADLLLVDGVEGLGNGRTLPLGPLREPPDHARFADALVLTRCADRNRIEEVRRTVPFPAGRPVAVSRMVPVSLVDRDRREFPLPSPGEEVAAFAGVARNRQFREMLEGVGFRVASFRGFADHHRYVGGDLRRIAAEAEGLPVVTTEKDMIRLPREVPFPVRALRIDVEFLEGWEPLSRLLLDRIGWKGSP